MNASARNIRVSEELAGHLEKMQRTLVKMRRVVPLIELHALGFDLSPALHESMGRGFHEISRALLDLHVPVSDQTEYVAASRGIEAFQLLCSYHRPGRGALRSAISRGDTSMIEEITDNGVWVTNDLYSFVPRLHNPDPIDMHHGMLRMMVVRTQDQELTRNAMEVIARYAKPATLIDALHRSKAIRSTLIVNALCGGASGNVVALREEGVKVSALSVHHFIKNSLNFPAMRPMSESISNLLEFYRQDFPAGLPGSICGPAVRRLLDLGAKQMIRCQYTDEVTNLGNVRRGLALLAACSRPDARVALTTHVQGWIAHRDPISFPSLTEPNQAQLIHQCEQCFAVGDAMNCAFDASPSP